MFNTYEIEYDNRWLRCIKCGFDPIIIVRIWTTSIQQYPSPLALPTFTTLVTEVESFKTFFLRNSTLMTYNSLVTEIDNFRFHTSLLDFIQKEHYVVRGSSTFHIHSQKVGSRFSRTEFSSLFQSNMRTFNTRAIYMLKTSEKRHHGICRFKCYNVVY